MEEAVGDGEGGSLQVAGEDRSFVRSCDAGRMARMVPGVSHHTFHDFRLPTIEMSDPFIDAIAGSEDQHTAEFSGSLRRPRLGSFSAKLPGCPPAPRSPPSTSHIWEAPEEG